MDLSLSCRTCAGIADPGVSLVDPAHRKLANWAVKHIPNVKLDDDISKRLCINCIGQIKLHVQFREQFIKSQRLLIGMMEASESTRQSNPSEAIEKSTEERESKNVPSTSSQENTLSINTSEQDENIPSSSEEPPNKKICLSKVDLNKKYNLKELKIHINLMSEEEIKRFTNIIKIEDNEVETIDVKNKPGPKQTKIKTFADIKTEPLDEDELEELDNKPLIFRQLQICKQEPDFIPVEIKKEENMVTENTSSDIKTPIEENNETDKKLNIPLVEVNTRVKKPRKRKAKNNPLAMKEPNSVVDNVPNFVPKVNPNPIVDINPNPVIEVKVPKKRGRKPKIKPQLLINIPETRNTEDLISVSNIISESSMVNETSLEIPSQGSIQQEFVPKSPSKLPVQKIIWPSLSNQNNNPPSAVVPPFNLLTSLGNNKVTINENIINEDSNDSDASTVVAPDFSNEQEEISTQTSPILDDETSTQDTNSQNNSQDSQITSECSNENSNTLSQVSPVNNSTQNITTENTINNTISDMTNVIDNSNTYLYQNDHSIINNDFQNDVNFNNKIDNTQNLATIMQIQNAFIDPLPVYNNQSFTSGSIHSCFTQNQSDIQNLNNSSTYVTPTQDVSSHNTSIYNTNVIENNAYVPHLNPPPPTNYVPLSQPSSSQPLQPSSLQPLQPSSSQPLAMSHSSYVATTNTKGKKYLTIKEKKPRKPRTTKPKPIPPVTSNITMTPSIIPPINNKYLSNTPSNPNIDLPQQHESQIPTQNIYSNTQSQSVVSPDQTIFSSNTEGSSFTPVENNSNNVSSYQINGRNIYYNQQYSYIPSTDSNSYTESQNPSNLQTSDNTSVVNTIPDPQMSYVQPLIQNTPTYNQQMIPFMSSASSQPTSSVYVSPQHCYINPHNFTPQNHLMYQTSHPTQNYLTPVIQQQELQPTSIHPIQTPIPMYAYQNPANVMLSNINPGQSVSMYPNNAANSYSDQSNPNVPANNMYYYVNSYNNMQ